jgi:hypothetical protein
MEKKMKAQKNNRRHKMEKEMIKRVWKNFLFVVLPVLLGFAALTISLSLGSFIMGFAGLIAVVKKEMYSGWGTVRGPAATITGVLVIIIFWGIAIIALLNRW